MVQIHHGGAISPRVCFARFRVHAFGDPDAAPNRHLCPSAPYADVASNADADTLEYTDMAYIPDPDTCPHGLHWERHADTGGLYCSDCGAALTVSKSVPLRGGVFQHGDVLLRGSDGSVPSSRSEAGAGAGKVDRESGAGTMTASPPPCSHERRQQFWDRCEDCHGFIRSVAAPLAPAPAPEAERCVTCQYDRPTHNWYANHASGETHPFVLAVPNVEEEDKPAPEPSGRMGEEDLARFDALLREALRGQDHLRHMLVYAEARRARASEDALRAVAQPILDLRISADDIAAALKVVAPYNCGLDREEAYIKVAVEAVVRARRAAAALRGKT
jgi:hypothetical protein